MFGNMFANIDPSQLDEMLAQISGRAESPFGESPLPGDEMQPDQFAGVTKNSPLGGGTPKLPDRGQSAPPLAQMAREQMPQAQPPAARQPDFRSYQVNTSAPGAIANMTNVTSPNEEIAALLRQQYNTGFSDFMGAGSQFGPEYDERLKVIAQRLGENRASQFGDLYNAGQNRQFQGNQADLNRAFQGNEAESDRVLKSLLADKVAASQLGLQGLQNRGAMDVEGLRGQNMLNVAELQDRQSMNVDKLSTQAYMQSYAAAIQGGKDPVTADASARAVAENIRNQIGRTGGRPGASAAPGIALPAGQYADLGNGQMIPLGPDGQPLPGVGAGGRGGMGGPLSAQTVSRIDSLLTGAKPLTLGEGGKPAAWDQDRVNKLTEQIMAMKPNPAETAEFARRIKSGELGDPAAFEAALAQQAAGNYFLAQPPTRDDKGAYPGKYDIPDLFSLRTNPNGGLGARTAAGIQNVATGGLPTIRGVPVPPGLLPPPLSQGQGIPYNEVVLPGGRVVPFNPSDFRSVGGELGGANAQKKNASEQRAAYQGMLLKALMQGR